MKIKEKIYLLLKKIDELSTITLKNKPVKIHQMDLFQAIPLESFYEIKQILLKFKQ